MMGQYLGERIDVNPHEVMMRKDWLLSYRQV